MSLLTQVILIIHNFSYILLYLEDIQEFTIITKKKRPFKHPVFIGAITWEMISNPLLKERDTTENLRSSLLEDTLIRSHIYYDRELYYSSFPISSKHPSSSSSYPSSLSPPFSSAKGLGLIV